MFHIRIDDEAENSKRKFACGLGPELPEGDKYFFEGEILSWPGRMTRIDCPGCLKAFGYDEQPKLGTPIGELSGRPGCPGYEKFKQIAESWGYP
jgi:hypothetical protein